MPKMKTHSASKKRFKRTGGGLKRSKAYRRHLLTKKTRKNKRALRKKAYVHCCDISNIKQLLPYS